VLAKEIVARHYGKPADHSYFVGCSTGGREAMLMSQRYPTYFDGIVAGAPAMRTGHSNLSLRSSVVAFNNIAPRDPSGKPITAQAFSDADRKTIVDGIVNACDANDGVKDGMIFDQRSCTFDPATLVCKGAKVDGCLSSAQAAAVSKAFAGPKDSKGNPVYTGYYYDTRHRRDGRRDSGHSPRRGPSGRSARRARAGRRQGRTRGRDDRAKRHR
jgi:feruloyl esterase